MLRCIGHFGSGEGGSCAGFGVEGGAAEINPVEALPTSRFHKARKCVHVAGRNLVHGLPWIVGSPYVLIDGVAADAENTWAKTYEHADEVGV